jgi:hypothetical protein
MKGDVIVVNDRLCEVCEQMVNVQLFKSIMSDGTVHLHWMCLNGPDVSHRPDRRQPPIPHEQLFTFGLGLDELPVWKNDIPEASQISLFEEVAK